MSGPLAGLRIFDLTRILAGPTATQVLGDLGADVIKVERPGQGDDTRKWGPPYLKDGQGRDTGESAYYLAANRNKRSITIDLEQPEGQALARRLIARSDMLFENFKVGGLAKYGLAYEQLKDDFPGLIYCSLTGFGQTGPYAPRAGYDLLAQAMGGLMSITGERDGPPVKVGVGIADLVTGHLLHHRDPGRAASSPRDRPRPADRPGAARQPGQLPGQRGTQPSDRRHRAQGLGHRARDHRALWRVPDLGRPCHPRDRQ